MKKEQDKDKQNYLIEEIPRNSIQSEMESVASTSRFRINIIERVQRLDWLLSVSQWKKKIKIEWIKTH